MSTPPTPPANARPCRAVDVWPSVHKGSGAGGHSVTYIRFRNVSHSTCLLTGYPHVTASEPGRANVVGSRGSFFPSGPAADLVPGADSTRLGLEWDSNCAARPGGLGGGANYHHFSITMPGGGSVSVAVPSEGLDLTCGLHLTPFFDPDYPQSEPIYPLAGLVAQIVLPLTARAGQPLDYEVDLHNATSDNVALAPCPEYIEATLGQVRIKNNYALNCAPVSTLAAGKTVRFAMRLLIPADTPAGALQIFWGLTGTPSVSATGTEVITR